ncbi:O-antigen ligase family protein [Cryobacterium sp. TMT2-14]|uniref:O-antigen ligase family protein n=1 Tax=Cryobacterium sp. TMT2-14 TaxID=1259245 RepID=UPI00106DA2E7|nr:O-antigen ligase family protein [Cryobacterium sp. TMT2-14]TFC33844.1 O-antigen ligase domain-containing protein [Cryobacterium sp. TMT2-14]
MNSPSTGLTAVLLFAGVLSAVSIYRLFVLYAPKSILSVATASIVGIFLATAAPSMFSKVASQQVTFYSALKEPVTLNGRIFDIASGVGLVALAGVLLVALLRAMSSSRSILSATVGPPLALATIFGAISAGTLLNSHRWPSLVIITVIILLLAVILKDFKRHNLTFGVTLISQCIALASAVSGLLGLPGAVEICRADKCGVAGVLFSGVASHENSLALMLVMTLPFLLVIGDRRLMATSACAVLLLVVVSGSRTSLLALGGLALVWFLVVVHGDRVPRFRPGILALVPLGGIALSVVLTTSDLAPSAFTGRAGLWEIARGYIATNPWIGLGAEGWSDIRRTTGSFDSASVYSPHNLFLDVWLQGGFIAGVAFVVLLGYWIGRGIRGDFASLFYVTTLVWAGILERPVSFGAPDWSTIALASGILLLASSPRDEVWPFRPNTRISAKTPPIMSH